MKTKSCSVEPAPRSGLHSLLCSLLLMTATMAVHAADQFVQVTKSAGRPSGRCGRCRVAITVRTIFAPTSVWATPRIQAGQQGRYGVVVTSGDTTQTNYTCVHVDTQFTKITEGEVLDSIVTSNRDGS